PPSATYTLPLHDALPIYPAPGRQHPARPGHGGQVQPGLLSAGHHRDAPRLQFGGERPLVEQAEHEAVVAGILLEERQVDHHALQAAAVEVLDHVCDLHPVPPAAMLLMVGLRFPAGVRAIASRRWKRSAVCSPQTGCRSRAMRSMASGPKPRPGTRYTSHASGVSCTTCHWSTPLVPRKAYTMCSPKIWRPSAVCSTSSFRPSTDPIFGSPRPQAQLSPPGRAMSPLA